MGKLDGKVAIVTGAGQGVGKAIALTLAREGADILANDLNDPNLEILATEIKDLGRKIKTIVADISMKDDVYRMVDLAIKTFGKLDILVNNAGITRFAPFLDMTEQDWDDVININLKGTFLCSQAVAKDMVVSKYGKIINIASIAGLGALNETQANYAASKAGVINLTRVMALALGEYGINVNAVAPGAIVTEMGLTRRTPEEYKVFLELRKSQTALHRIGDVQDIANVVLFLASDDSSFMTGQVISSDGGHKDSFLR
ncbi:SDR family NAD(P)-dependent oxidoreductase [Chloroflexota bacterium]